LLVKGEHKGEQRDETSPPEKYSFHMIPLLPTKCQVSI